MYIITLFTPGYSILNKDCLLFLFHGVTDVNKVVIFYKIEVLSTNYMYHLGVVWVFFHILIKSFYIIHENLIQSLFNRQNVLTKLELTTIF